MFLGIEVIFTRIMNDFYVVLLGKCWPNLHLNKSSISCLCQRFKRVPRWNYCPTSGPCAQIVVFAEELIIQAKMAADHNQAHGGNLIWQTSPWRRHFSLQLWIGSLSWLIERKSWSKQSTRFWLKFSSLKQSLHLGNGSWIKEHAFCIFKFRQPLPQWSRHSILKSNHKIIGSKIW